MDLCSAVSDYIRSLMDSAWTRSHDLVQAPVDSSRLRTLLDTLPSGLF